MIILPDRHAPVGRFFLPIARSAWMPSSQAMPKDRFGNPDLRLIHVTAVRAGQPVWRGYFEDQDDANAFLEGLALHIAGAPMPRSLWDLPQRFRWRGFPETFSLSRISGPWCPEIDEEATYIYASTATISSSPGSNQTYTSDATWNNSVNTVQVIAGGGGGGAVNTGTGANRSATGGGGAASNEITNFAFASPGTTTATAHAAATGAGAGVGSTAAGSAGGDGWFNGTTLAGASVGSKGGGAGATGTSGGCSGGAGGVGASGVGTSLGNGGRGGNCNAGNQVTGGGGACGLGGSGGAGTDNGNATAGGGGNGANSGGGGAGSNSTGIGGSSFGGAGGGGNTNGSASGGTGAQGIILLTWTPVAAPIYTNLEGHLRGVNRGLVH